MSATRVPVDIESALDAEELGHVGRLREQLTAEIRAAGGWVSFERYMEAALYTPGLGYYSAGAHKLGQGGDFTTAPEISRLFGGCLAQQCAEVLSGVEGGSILEIGAGTGTLAADILSRLESLGLVPQRYSILDVSADLRDRQRRTLQHRVPHLMNRVQWLDLPPVAAFDGVILANEVLDALPVRRFRWHPGHCEELGVAIDGDRFAWAPRAAGESLTRMCDSLAAAGGGWDDGYVSEYCPRLPAWTREVTRALRRGAVLWMDYGLPRAQYYFPERRDGTLLCHFRQRAHGDPLSLPGLQDITAWVDFTLLAQCTAPAGYQLAGFTTQAYFLAALGLDREMQMLAAGAGGTAGAGGAEGGAYAKLANEARRLVMPGEMGERFKAMAWSRNWDAPLRGFSLHDMRHTL